ncbi:unnamed protein product [Vitrella brassicaformis CCMP3155]|uniref:Apple domain-containing protein n=2 Tax=Vitrella brassicaformis TaxID=1169539 RepID=A0A0G4FLP1_VITBC|nr:unnamed protein product [Vitrella brassicaformis CCMP3155]|eukprot:CEM14936.1 unnamed protein product [Vitrella brassicaformis CCMP3155]
MEIEGVSRCCSECLKTPGCEIWQYRIDTACCDLFSDKFMTKGAERSNKTVVGMPLPIRKPDGGIFIRDATEIDNNTYLSYRAVGKDILSDVAPLPRFPYDFAFATTKGEMQESLKDDYNCIKVLSNRDKEGYFCAKKGLADLKMEWLVKADANKQCVKIATDDTSEDGYLCFEGWPQAADLVFVSGGALGLEKRETCMRWVPTLGYKTWTEAYLCARTNEFLGNVSRSEGGWQGKLFCANWDKTFIANPEFQAENKPPNQRNEWWLILISPDHRLGDKFRVEEARCCETAFGAPCVKTFPEGAQRLAATILNETLIVVKGDAGMLKNVGETEQTFKLLEKEYLLECTGDGPDEGCERGIQLREARARRSGNPCLGVGPKKVVEQTLHFVQGPPLLPVEWLGHFLRNGTKEEVYQIVQHAGVRFPKKKKVAAKKGANGCCMVRDDKDETKLLKTCDRKNPIPVERFILETMRDEPDPVPCKDSHGNWSEVGINEAWVLGCLAVGGGCKLGVGSEELCKVECEHLEAKEKCNSFNYFNKDGKPSSAECCLQSCPDVTNPVKRQIKPKELPGWKKIVNFAATEGIDVSQLKFPSPGCSAVVLQNRDANNGVYSFNIDGIPFKSYCVFDRTRGHIWTLIRSVMYQDFLHKEGFGSTALTDDYFGAVNVSNLTEITHVNEPPQRVSFDLGYTDVPSKLLTSKAAEWTHFLATCDFNTDMDEDFMLFEFRKGDQFPLALNSDAPSCQHLEAYTLLHKHCKGEKCQLPISQKTGETSFHVNPVQPCEGDDTLKGVSLKEKEKFFGSYERPPEGERFMCAASKVSITNFWLGEKFPSPHENCGHFFSWDLKPGFKCVGEMIRELDWVDPEDQTKSSCTLCKTSEPADKVFEKKQGVWSGYKVFDYADNGSPRPCTHSDACFADAQRSETGVGTTCDWAETPGKKGSPAVPAKRVAQFSVHDTAREEPDQDVLCRAYMMEVMLSWKHHNIGCYEVHKERGDITVCNLYNSTVMWTAGGSFRAGRVTFPLCPHIERKRPPVAMLAGNRTSESAVDSGNMTLISLVDR